MMPNARSFRLACGALVAIALFTSCGGGADPAQESTAGTLEPTQAVEDLVRKSIIAENKADAKLFVSLWTDKGLEEYDVGSRKELLSGKSEGFGEDKLTIVKFVEVKAADGKGTATFDVLTGDHRVSKPVFRARMSAGITGGKWLLDGFEFLGSPPPAEGVPVVTINATEYAFNLDKSEASGNFAFKFANKGKEAHEISFFKAPAGTSVATAKAALENVDGSELKDLPAGYAVDHIGFSDPGSSVDLTFAEPIPAGEYFLVCYIPQGGFTQEGDPVNPQGVPHIKLGMISKLTVK